VLGVAVGDAVTAASTVNDSALLVTEFPFESVTVTVTEYDPCVLGVQVIVAVFAGVHPAGRPDHRYVEYVRDPPVGAAVNVTDC
jgi:hypothetical protein